MEDFRQTAEDASDTGLFDMGADSDVLDVAETLRKGKMSSVRAIAREFTGIKDEKERGKKIAKKILATKAARKEVIRGNQAIFRAALPLRIGLIHFGSQGNAVVLTKCVRHKWGGRTKKRNIGARRPRNRMRGPLKDTNPAALPRGVRD